MSVAWFELDSLQIEPCLTTAQYNYQYDVAYVHLKQP